ncbi:MAG: hypothetical protein GY759_09020 [Chloroflexi bacterium]|nr:hypothetical protein [Chloroflexota bacterium]
MAERLGHDWSVEKKAEAWDNEMMGSRRRLELLDEQAKELLALRGELFSVKEEHRVELNVMRADLRRAKDEAERLRTRLEENNG